MTAFIKDSAFKFLNSVIIPIKRKPLDFVSKILALLGGYYSLCEIEQAVLNRTVLLDSFRKHFWIFLIAVVLIAILLHKKTSVSFCLLRSKRYDSVTLHRQHTYFKRFRSSHSFKHHIRYYNGWRFHKRKKYSRTIPKEVLWCRFF